VTYSAELQDVQYNTEAAFAEVSTTFGTALPLITAVDLSGCSRAMEPVPFVKQRPWEGTQHVRMPWTGAKVTLKMRMTGMGATQAGAVSSSDLATFLGMIVGNVASSLATGTTFTGGTATIPTTTAASGVVAGALVRGGSIGDGRVGGQFLPVSAHSTNNLTLLLAAPAAPNNGDVLYAGKMIYPYCLTPSQFEVPTTFRLRVLTSNGQYDLRGCFPLSAPQFSGVSMGQIPEVTIEIGVSSVVTASTTFPSATVPQRHASSPVVNGSFAWAAVGTVTRSSESKLREIGFDLGWSGEGLMGPGGNTEGQVIQAARRKAGMATLDITVDNDGPDTWRARADTDENTGRVFYHACYSVTCADGRGFGVYWPRLAICKAIPIQVNHQGYNRERVSFEAQLGGTTTTDLTASPVRLAMA
jgi:hypothetical protein